MTGTRRSFTRAEIGEIHRLRADGKTVGEIAKALGAERHAVNYQYHRPRELPPDYDIHLADTGGSAFDPQVALVADGVFAAQMAERRFADTKVSPVGRMSGRVDSAAGLGASSAWTAAEQGREVLCG